MTTPGIVFHDVRYGYDPRIPVLDELSVNIGPGLTLILGPNGSGKSTFLRLAAGVEKPDRGTITVHGQDLWKREAEARRDLAYLPQEADVTPYASVEAVLRFVAALRGEDVHRVAEISGAFDLTEVESRSVRELSQGQRHRVLLAAARLGSPRTLLLDEPFSAIDLGTQERTRSWIEETCATGGTALVVTHDLEPLADAASRAVVMRTGTLRLIPELPADPVERRRLLAASARGD